MEEDLDALSDEYLLERLRMGLPADQDNRIRAELARRGVVAPDRASIDAMPAMEPAEGGKRMNMLLVLVAITVLLVSLSAMLPGKLGHSLGVAALLSGAFSFFRLLFRK